MFRENEIFDHSKSMIPTVAEKLPPNNAQGFVLHLLKSTLKRTESEYQMMKPALPSMAY